MSVKDVFKTIAQKIGQGPTQDDFHADKVSSLTQGGFTGYHPKANTESVKRGRGKKKGQPAQATAQQMAFNTPPMQGNGFTSYQQFAQGNATGYQPQFAQNNATGYQQQFAPNNGNGYQPQFAQNNGTGYQSQFVKTEPPVQQPQFSHVGTTGYQPPQSAPQNAAQNAAAPQQNASASQYPHNITYMGPGFSDENGQSFRHLERIAQVTSVAQCYHLIEFMRNTETVLVNVEAIEDDTEKQRALDLIYGAAFTMNCTFMRIARKSIYLVAPREVMVQTVDSIRQASDEDLRKRWPNGQAGYAAAPGAAQMGAAPVRERVHGTYTPYTAPDRYAR